MFHAEPHIDLTLINSFSQKESCLIKIKIRFFDKNGKEIIREPLNLDKVEHIAEIGGTIEKFSIGLNFYSENLQRKEIFQNYLKKITKNFMCKI